MENGESQVIVHFESDSENTVSLETAKSLMTIVGATSLEALIQQALVQLKNTVAIAYPPDDGLPTEEQFAAIARLIPQDMQLKALSSLFDDYADHKVVADNEYSLQELMAGVTEDNKHERIDFGKPVGKEML